MMYCATHTRMTDPERENRKKKKNEPLFLPLFIEPTRNAVCCVVVNVDIGGFFLLPSFYCHAKGGRCQCLNGPGHEGGFPFPLPLALIVGANTTPNHHESSSFCFHFSSNKRLPSFPFSFLSLGSNKTCWREEQPSSTTTRREG